MHLIQFWTVFLTMSSVAFSISVSGVGTNHFNLACENVTLLHWCFHLNPQGVYYQTGDVIKVTDEEDGKPYYAQIRGFIQDQYCEKSAALTWLIPTQSSPKDHFDPGTYIVGEQWEIFIFIASGFGKLISQSIPQVQRRIYPERWSTWSLCAMPLQNILSHGALHSQPSQSDRKKVTFGRT